MTNQCFCFTVYRVTADCNGCDWCTLCHCLHLYFYALLHYKNSSNEHIQINETKFVFKQLGVYQKQTNYMLINMHTFHLCAVRCDQNSGTVNQPVSGHFTIDSSEAYSALTFLWRIAWHYTER